VKRTPRLTYALILLVCLDLTFIVLDNLYLRSILGERFSFEREYGYPELYQHVKELALAVSIVVLLIKTSDILYLPWTFLFIYFFADDTFQIHERLGTLLSQQLGFVPAYGLRARDFGELLISCIAFVVFVVLLGFTYRRGSETAKRQTKVFLILLVCLGLFGVLGDLLHVEFAQTPRGYWLGTLEDGGELILISLMLAFAFQTSNFKFQNTPDDRP
jgi:hypothetical protein